MSGPQQMHEVWIDTAEGGQSLWQVSQRKLGQGAFADVYEARGPGGQSAVAKVSVEPFENEGRDGEAVALQASQGHPSIVRYLGEGSVGNKRVLLLEHVRGGDLMDRVLKHSALVEHEAARAISQLLAALDHIQSRGVCHGRYTTSMSTDRRGMSRTKRLMAVPPFIAKMSLANTSGATASSRRTVSA